MNEEKGNSGWVPFVFWVMQKPFLCAWAAVLSWGTLCAAPAGVLGDFLARADVAGLRTTVSSEVRSMGAETSATDHLALAQAELLRAVGDSGVQAVLAQSGGAAFLQEFMGNREWLEMFLASGPVEDGKPAADGLAVLFSLWKADRGEDAMGFRPLATAVALSWAAEPFRETMIHLQESLLRPITPEGRYFFFRDACFQGKLDPIFRTLSAWSLRFVVAAPYDDESLAWALENVNIPAWRYTEACWFVEYRGQNAFGDTVQGPLFYMPWREGQNTMLNVRRHGGVCGSLSTFGSVAARAHGIPSYTVGQPGHCAYAVRLGDGNWEGGFGGPAGSPHHYFWGQSYYYILLMEEAFSGVLTTPEGTVRLLSAEAAQARILASQREVWRARQAMLRGDDTAAFQAASAAVAVCPTNFAAWTLRIELAQKNPAVLSAGWPGLASEIISRLANHTRPMCDLLARFDEKYLLPGMDDTARTAWFARVHRTVARTKGKIAWDWKADELLGRQMKFLSKDSDARWTLFQNVVALHAATSEQLLGQLLDWGVKNLGEDGADKCIAALAAVVNDEGGGLSSKTTEKILATAVLAAEKARSIAAFQAAARAAEKYVKVPDPLELERPEGLKLVSGDGLLLPSTTSGWDRPLEHSGVLNERGGFFHTAAEKAPSATVELRKTTLLTGVLLVNTEGNRHRQSPLVLSVSTDGATWHKIWESHEVRQQWYVPLEEKGVRARWVKVESPHDTPEVFHLRNILVYGEDAQ